MAQKRHQTDLILTQGPLPVVALAQPVISARDSLLSKNTIRGYVRDWKDFFGVEDLSTITLAQCLAVQPEEVTAFRNRLINERIGPGTICRKLTALRTLYDYLIERKLAILNPANKKLVRSPKRGTVKKMERLSMAEAKTLLNAIDRSTPIGRRDYALIMTDLHMGLRRSETLSITSGQFKTDGDEAYLVFRSKGEKERKVTVNKDLEEALKSYFADRGNEPGWLFPGRDGQALSGNQFWKIMEARLDAVGIKKKVGTHGLRSTFITHNIEIGTPLSEIQSSVGHSRPETTLGYARDLEMIKNRAPKAMEGFKAD
jgi:site-specific recombinase XerD